MKTKTASSKKHLSAVVWWRKATGFSHLEVCVIILVLLFSVCTIIVASETLEANAQAILCQSRLGQLSRALFDYTADYDGWIMPYSTVGPKGATDNMPWRCPHGDFFPNLDVDEEYWYGILYVNNGLNNRDVLFCPSTATPDNETLRLAQANQGSTNVKDIEHFGMGWTFGLRDWADPTEGVALKWANNRAPKKVDKMPRPSDFFLITDTVLYDPVRYRNTGSNYGQFFVAYDRGRAGSNGWTTGVHLRHDGKAATVFADGHAEFKGIQYWIDLQNPNHWQQNYCLTKMGYRVFDANNVEWTRDPTTGLPRIMQ